MSISIYIVPISKGAELVTKLLHEELGISLGDTEDLYKRFVKNHFDKLKDSIYLLAETGYVDKVYRDTYYHYHSSKLNQYRRDCVRISLFEDEVTDTDFLDRGKRAFLQENYRGFFVLRPTQPFVIGRSIISPLALKDNNFVCCSTDFNATANAIKLKVRGFPHSSQDTETITCAETSLWAIMEYFCTNFTEYRPVLPSKIIQTLNNVSNERLIPSKGLNIDQMSFALKEFGFGSRMYSRDQYPNDFDRLISCYIESGIPIIVALINEKRTIAHASICIGHEKIINGQWDSLQPLEAMSEKARFVAGLKKVEIFDSDSLPKKFVFVDDNQPVYQLATLDKPAKHYSSQDWHSCKIEYFIAPLYTKIYLEAYLAKDWVMNFLITGPSPLKDDSKVVLRFYLASSRSYKNELSKNSSMQDDLRGFLLEASMPKFVWVAELSDKNLIKQDEANGLIIVDATEANIYSNKPLIMAAFQEKMIFFEEDTGKLVENVLTLQAFKIYSHNLNAFDL